MEVERRLEALGLTLPPALQPPPALKLPFPWCRVRGHRVFLSGHGAQAADGTPIGPFGRVPDEVPLEAAQEGARLIALATLGTLKRALGDLDRISAWLMVNGMVNAHPGYAQTTNVVNGFSDVILDVFGAEVGAHARTAVGVAALPMNCAIVISAEIEVDT